MCVLRYVGLLLLILPNWFNNPYDASPILCNQLKYSGIVLLTTYIHTYIDYSG